MFSSLFAASCEPALATPYDDLQKLFGGIASWYGGKFHGRRTASGTIYNMNQMTCAHKTLPFGTKLLVFNPHNGRKVEVVVTDRGPYVGQRVIDLSKAAADKLNIQGIGNVVCYVGRKVLSEVAETIQIKQGSNERRASANASASSRATASANSKSSAVSNSGASAGAVASSAKAETNEVVASKLELHKELQVNNTEEADQYQMVLVSASLNHGSRTSPVQAAMAETAEQESSRFIEQEIAPDAFAVNGSLQRISNRNSEGDSSI
jgi:rare lipoprotein A